MLDVIRDRTGALWNDFLQPEFGFKEQFLQATFWPPRSHLHYRDLHPFISILRLEENLFRTYVAKALTFKED